MIIGGIQKLSLIDYPGKVATIVFTKGCIFRCPYCHNPDLVTPKDYKGIPEGEWWEHLEKRKKFIDGVVVTGGEPTLHPDLPEFIRKVKRYGYLVKLDTNGITPGMVRDMIKEKLIDYFAMDIKHTWDNYQLIANVKPERVENLKKCHETFDIIRNSGVPYEWRTTVLPGVHTEDDFVKMAESFIPGEQYYLQAINYKVTLSKDLNRSVTLDVGKIAERLRKTYPELLVNTR